MYHIILVDDEKVALEGLYEVVSQEFAECQVYMAGNSAEAIRLFEEYRIDIAVIDINMPGISGLELQRRIRDDWPRCRCIFLTGYDRSDYMRQAIRGGSVDYILKLEGDEAVIRSIHENLERLGQEEAKLLEEACIRSRLDEKQGQVKRYLLQEIWKTPVRDREEFLRMSEDAGAAICFDRPFWILMGKLTPEGRDDFKAKRDHMKLLEAAFRQIVQVKCPMECVTDEESVLLCFLQLEGSGMEELHRWKGVELQKKLLQHLEALEDVCWTRLERELIFSAFREEVQLEDAYGRIQQLKMSFFYKSFSGQDDRIFLDKEEMAPREGKENGVDPVMDVEKLICDGQKIKAYQLVLQILHENPGEASWRISQKSFYQCALALSQAMDKLHMQPEISRSFDLSRLMEYHDFGDVYEMEYYFASLLHSIFRLRESRDGGSQDETVLLVNNYINSHLAEDLSMQVLAEVVHLNPSYLSRLYKGKTGQSVSGYIFRTRLERACQLLRKTQDKISEIAKKTGFASAGYFSSSFRREYGQTPQEYREKGDVVGSKPLKMSGRSER